MVSENAYCDFNAYCSVLLCMNASFYMLSVLHYLLIKYFVMLFKIS
jgi:hypothetical protein